MYSGVATGQVAEGSKNILGELLKERVECLAAASSAFPAATKLGLGNSNLLGAFFCILFARVKRIHMSEDQQPAKKARFFHTTRTSFVQRARLLSKY